jgi:hypothetical protein
MRRSACRKRAAPKSRIHSAVTILPVKPTHSGAGASDAHHLGRPFSSTPRGRVGGAKSSADVWTLAAGLGTGGAGAGSGGAGAGSGGAGAGSGGRSCITGCGAASRTGALRNCNGRVRLSRRASRTQDDHRGDQHARADEDAIHRSQVFSGVKCRTRSVTYNALLSQRMAGSARRRHACSLERALAVTKLGVA